MKSFIALFILFLGLTFVNCKNDSATEETAVATEKVDKSGIEYTSNYICPIHCKGSGSDQAGECPTCGMDYVVNKEKKNDHSGHSHDHSGHDHDHGDHSGHNH